MGLYLGSKQLRIALGSSICNLIIPSKLPFINWVLLLSYDNYILTDSNGVYLTVKEDE